MLVTLRCHRATDGLSNSWLCCHISSVISHSLRRQLMLYAELISDDNIGCDILNRQWSKKKKNTKTGKQLHRSTKIPTWMCRFQEQETWAEVQESLLLSSSFCSCHLEDLSLLPIYIEWFCHHQNSLHKLEEMLKYHSTQLHVLSPLACWNITLTSVMFYNFMTASLVLNPNIHIQYLTLSGTKWWTPPPQKKFFHPGLHRSDC